jgi:type II/III secretion system protein
VTKHLQTLAFACAFALASTAFVSTQEKDKEKTPTPAARAAAALNTTPLKLQIVIGRYQGEKKISSMPYTMSVLAGNGAHLRMGTRIPVMMVTTTNTPKDTPQVGPVQYQDVGTNIDCSATALDDGRFALTMTLEDSSVYPDDQPPGVRGNPSFRSFRATNGFVLKNGETGQFTTAADKVTGETVKVDVTLTVLK